MKMEESEIRTYKLEKHQTKDIKDGHVNGWMVPVWRNWDKIISVQPEMVYVTSINPVSYTHLTLPTILLV